MSISRLCILTATVLRQSGAGPCAGRPGRVGRPILSKNPLNPQQGKAFVHCCWIERATAQSSWSPGAPQRGAVWRRRRRRRPRGSGRRRRTAAWPTACPPRMPCTTSRRAPSPLRPRLPLANAPQPLSRLLRHGHSTSIAHLHAMLPSHVRKCVWSIEPRIMCCTCAAVLYCRHSLHRQSRFHQLPAASRSSAEPQT